MSQILMADMADYRFRLDLDRHVATLARWLVDDLRSGALGTGGAAHWREVNRWAKRVSGWASDIPRGYPNTDSLDYHLYNYVTEHATARGWLRHDKGEGAYLLTAAGHALGEG